MRSASAQQPTPPVGAPLRSSDQRKAFGGLCVLSLACVAAVLVVRSVATGIAPAAADEAPLVETPELKYTSLGELMRSGINQEAATLSFLVWHQESLDASGLESVERSAAAIEELCHEMRRHAKRSWSRDETTSFHIHIDALAEAADRLGAAARGADAKGVSSAMGSVEKACSACHTRLAPNFTKKDMP